MQRSAAREHAVDHFGGGDLAEQARHEVVVDSLRRDAVSRVAPGAVAETFEPGGLSGAGLGEPCSQPLHGQCVLGAGRDHDLVAVGGERPDQRGQRIEVSRERGRHDEHSHDDSYPINRR